MNIHVSNVYIPARFFTFPTFYPRFLIAVLRNSNTVARDKRYMNLMIAQIIPKPKKVAANENFINHRGIEKVGGGRIGTLACHRRTGKEIDVEESGLLEESKVGCDDEIHQIRNPGVISSSSPHQTFVSLENEDLSPTEYLHQKSDPLSALVENITTNYVDPRAGDARNLKVSESIYGGEEVIFKDMGSLERKKNYRNTLTRETDRLPKGGTQSETSIDKDDKDQEQIESTKELDESFMLKALLEAKKAAMAGEVPVGAVLVQNGRIIARAYNRVEIEGDPTAHAEMLCIRTAAKCVGNWRLTEATLYVTMEPCPMCAGALLQARVKEVVWGARNTLLGADGSWVSLFPKSVKEESGEGDSNPTSTPAVPAPVHPFHKKVEIRRGVLADDCSAIMQSFFRARRKQKSTVMKKKPWWLHLAVWVLLKRFGDLLSSSINKE